MPSRKTLSRTRQKATRDRLKEERKEAGNETSRDRMARRLMDSGATTGEKGVRARASDGFWIHLLGALVSSSEDTPKLRKAIGKNPGRSRGDMAMAYLERTVLDILVREYGFSPVDGVDVPLLATGMMMNLIRNTGIVVKMAEELLSDLDFEINPFRTGIGGKKR